MENIGWQHWALQELRERETHKQGEEVMKKGWREAYNQERWEGRGEGEEGDAAFIFTASVVWLCSSCRREEVFPVPVPVPVSVQRAQPTTNS